MNLNKAQLIGRVTKDPELRTLQSGTQVCKFSVATNNVYVKDGQKVEEVDFHNVVAFGKQAETIAQWVKKGQLIYVEGRIKNSSYEKDGVKRYTSEILLNGFQFGPKAKGSESVSGQEATAQEDEGDGQTPKSDTDIPF